MTDDNAFRLGKRAVRLIKEGTFDLDAWQEIYDGIGNKDLLSLVSSLRNTLAYGKDTKKIRGLVKAGYINSIEKWDSARSNNDSEIAVIGDRAVKVANDFIKKNGIEIE